VERVKKSFCTSFLLFDYSLEHEVKSNFPVFLLFI
jgi:hypothetical protein